MNPSPFSINSKTDPLSDPTFSLFGHVLTDGSNLFRKPSFSFSLKIQGEAISLQDGNECNESLKEARARESTKIPLKGEDKCLQIVRSKALPKDVRKTSLGEPFLLRKCYLMLNTILAQVNYYLGYF